MRRALLALVFVLVLPLAIVAALVVRTVPEGTEAVRVARDGSIAVLGPGVHLVVPGSKLVRYPSGRRTVRVPPGGEMALHWRDGSLVRRAFVLEVAVPPGASRRLYETFSSDFDAAFERLVRDAAETEAAALEPGRVDALERRVVERVAAQLARAGVRVRAASLADGGGRAAQGQRGASETGAGAPGGAAADGADERTGERTRRATPVRRLIVVGVDGGDWLNIRPLVDAGRLPNFARLLREGATGPLRSQPPLLSPLLWTTMATGRHPEQHGILNFTVVDPETGRKVPITRYYRRVDAFWNMLSDYGERVAVVGWLATDPAEAVNGLMVTDKVGYVAYAPDDTSASVAPTSVWPRERVRDVARRVVHVSQVPWDDIRAFVDVSREAFRRRRDAPFDPRDPVNNLIHIYASTLTMRDIALEALERDQPDVLAVYFELVDAVSHLFMLYAPPRMPDVPEADFARYRNAVDRACEVQDAILGAFMERCGPGTVLMVVSDHGFRSGGARLRNRPEIWAGNAAKWHRPEGIVALWGDGVRRGARIEGASILDIAPTILALAGLPRAADMPGRPLAAAFEDSVAARFRTDTVPTLDRPRTQSAPDEPGGSAAEDETMRKLEALGYVTPDNADAHNNLGQRYEARGEYGKAIEEYRRAVAMRPDFHGAWNNLAVCYGKLGRYEEAEQALRRTIELEPGDFYAMNNLAVMYIRTKRLDEARRWAERAVATEPGYANGHVTLGSVLAMQGRLEEARREFEQALRIDPGLRSAAANLERVRRQLEGR